MYKRQSLRRVAAVREEQRGTVITLSGEVLFATGESALLPIAQPELERDLARDGAAGVTRDYLFEPDRGALLDRLVPMYVEIAILRALFESQASEFGARMSAMDSATKNAKDMINRLTLQYNRARQAAITKELMEIIGGSEALKELSRSG